MTVMRLGMAAGVALAATLTIAGQPASAAGPGIASSSTSLQACSGKWESVYGKSAYIRNHRTGEIGGGIQLEKRDCGVGRDPEYRTAMLIYSELRLGTDAVAGVYGSSGDAYCRAAAGGTFCATPPVKGAYRIRGEVRQFLGDGVWQPYASGEWPKP